MQAPKKPRIAFFVVAAILSAVIAMGFFMDPVVAAGWGALVTVVPELGEWTSPELWPPSDESPSLDGTVGEATTKRPWWEWILDGFTPDPPEDLIPSYETDVEYVTKPSYDYPQTDPPYFGWDEPNVPSVSFGYYTNEEMVELYCDQLAEVLAYLATSEQSGQISPIDSVGVFELDVDGVPEIITVTTSDGYVRYTVYGLYSATELSYWKWKGSNPGELTLWSYVASDELISSTYPSFSSSASLRFVSFRSIIMHDEGGDNYVSEITRGGLQFETLFKDVHSGNERFYFVNDELVDRQSYYDFYDQFKQENTPMTETTRVLWSWTPDRPTWMAKQLLNSEQQFFKVGK